MPEEIAVCDKCKREPWMSYVFFYQDKEDISEARFCMKCWQSNVLPLIKSETKGKRREAN